jgi:receptor protein-tyrosine kinase
MRTNLQFLSVDDPPRVIVVTSSAPSEGKSTTAINLALSLAEAENSVVLVDGDLRRPTVSKYLDLVSAVGFSTVLSGAVPLSDVLQDTKFPRLTVLAAGATPPNPSELLGSHAAKRTLEELRSRFDFVIVDSPPLLAVTDAAVLATNADGALVMTRFGETKHEQLAHAVRSLRDAGANVLGAVFTLVPTSGPGYYGAYRYNYSYYGESETKTRTKSRRTMKFSRPKSDGPSSAQQPPEERSESADVTQSRIDI